jgi:peptide deformylase
MTVRTILKMGDPRLLRLAKPVTEFDTDALHLLLKDLLDTMHAANGAGLAAPQIGEVCRWWCLARVSPIPVIRMPP